MFDHNDGVAFVHQSLEHEQQFAHILEMQAGGRLIENVHGFAGGTALQLSGELHALGFASGQRRGRLSKANISEADLHQGIEITRDGRIRLEESSGLLDGHIEYVGDGFAIVLHLEGLTVVALAMTFLAVNVDIRQKVHLDFQRTVSMAGFASTALDIE